MPPLAAPSLRLTRPIDLVKIFRQQLRVATTAEAQEAIQSKIAAAEKARDTPLQITDGDREIIHIIADFWFASSDQIARRIGRSPAKVRHRLRLLFAHQYVDRPVQQNVYLSAFYDEGNRPICYALTRKGLHLLAECGQVVDHRLQWTLNNNSRATAPFIAHALEVAEAMLAFHTSGEGAPRLIDHTELIPYFPGATRASHDPFRLSVSFTHEMRPVTLRVRPDRLFSLVMPDDTRMNFALELDRSTEVIRQRKSKLNKSSIAKKILTYYHAFLQKKHTELWGMDRIRILFITPSEIRLHNMIAAQREITRDRLAGLFLYSTPERLARHGAFGPAWVSAKQAGISLLPVPSPQANPGSR